MQFGATIFCSGTVIGRKLHIDVMRLKVSELLIVLFLDSLISILLFKYLDFT